MCQHSRKQRGDLLGGVPVSTQHLSRLRLLAPGSVTVSGGALLPPGRDLLFSGLVYEHSERRHKIGEITEDVRHSVHPIGHLELPRVIGHDRYAG